MTHGRTSWPFSTPNKILVATDLTDLDYLLPSAIAQCRDGEASLILAHAIAPVESMSLADSALLIADCRAGEGAKEPARGTKGFSRV
jgi:hypothetical protein